MVVAVRAAARRAGLVVAAALGVAAHRLVVAVPMDREATVSFRNAVSLLFLVVSCLGHPTRARCPIGYDLRTGIRSDGRFECWPSPTGPSEWDGTWARPERSVQPDGVIESRIYCTGGARPIVVDARTVGCQRGGWR